MSYTPSSARQRLARALASKPTFHPLQLRILALFAAGEIREKGRQPVKVKQNPADGPFSPHTVERYIPFTRWLRPLDADSIEKDLGAGPITPEEREVMKQLAGVMGTLYGVKS